MAETGVRTYKPSPNSICFHTAGVWSADDMRRFVTAMEKMYEPFLAFHLATLSRPSFEEQARRRFQQWMRNFGPLDRERMEELQSYYGVAPSLQLHRYPFMQRLTRNLAFVYDNIRTLAPHERLTIEAIRMGSDGFSVLQGLGEPIRES